jgi:hypothetical protein
MPAIDTVARAALNSWGASGQSPSGGHDISRLTATSSPAAKLTGELADLAKKTDADVEAVLQDTALADTARAIREGKTAETRRRGGSLTRIFAGCVAFSMKATCAFRAKRRSPIAWCLCQTPMPANQTRQSRAPDGVWLQRHRSLGDRALDARAITDRVIPAPERPPRSTYPCLEASRPTSVPAPKARSGRSRGRGWPKSRLEGRTGGQDMGRGHGVFTHKTG